MVVDFRYDKEELLRFDETSEDDGEIYMGKYHVVHSSGSTGTPRYFVYDTAAWEQMLVGIIRGALWGMSMGAVLKLLAEESAERVKVTEEIHRQVRKLLVDKELEEIQFSIRFVKQIIPDKHTGKKALIIKKMEEKRNDKNEHYRKAV